MKISKHAAAMARRLFGLCLVDGRLDGERLRAVVAKLAAEQPRDFRAVLAAMQRLVRLDHERRQVTVESAVELDAASRARVLASLAPSYGDDLVADYQVNPDLLGGLRIRVGNDILDGSVHGRIERLTRAF